MKVEKRASSLLSVGRAGLTLYRAPSLPCSAFGPLQVNELWSPAGDGAWQAVGWTVA